MKRIDVALGEHGYPLFLGDGLIDRAGVLLAPIVGDGRLYIVTDETVAGHGHAARLAAALGEQCLGTSVLPPGEAHKTFPTLEGLLETLIERGVGRSDVLLALGGGVVGDITGLAAALLKRGCRHVQLPTSLLAQVDSSVGGKTAINSRRGKNLIGAFHQPAAVLIDPATLDTLPERELRAGYAEVVKYGLIGDADFFEWCEANGPSLLAGDPQARLHAIATSVRAKAAIVAADERETRGVRALLNFGHSFGHAMEAATGFSDRLLHGEAVAAGMALAFRFSAELGLCDMQDADRVAAHLRSVGLPASLAEARVRASGAELLDHMRHDKKWSGGRPILVLTRGIGRAFVSEADPEALVAFLDRA